MVQDVTQIKERIISFIRLKGPSLPVHVAKDTGLSILFTSAFLSELFYEKRVIISNLKIGNSPLYFISGQEPQLENFSKYLKNKEKESFLLLKEKKILKDSELQPAIRVALRGIKDFAIPFKKNEEVYWRYFLNEESPELEKEIKIEKKQEIREEPKKKIERIFTKEKPKKEAKKKQNKKRDENFFNKIKEFLTRKGIEIIDIKDFKNDKAILKIKKEGNEELLFIFNKKKIGEKEILEAHKKASGNERYNIFSMGETPKKLKDLISAIKSLSEIDRIE